MSTCFEANRPISLTEIENVDGVSVIQRDRDYFLVSGDHGICIDEVNDRGQFTHVTRYGLNDASSTLLPIQKSLGITFFSEHQNEYWGFERFYEEGEIR